MTTYFPAKKNTAFVTYVSLPDLANAGLMKSNPTLASGDFKVSIDGGALSNLATLPSVTPASSKMVKISLSSSEMNGDNITVVCSDASGAEWGDLVFNIPTTARQIDDLAYPATSGRSIVVDASGLVDANTVKIGPSGSGTAQTARDVGASVLLSSGTGTGQVKLSGGYVAPNWGDVGNPTTTVSLTGTTVATATNLTNAPTAGDLTATMKASVSAAVWDAATASYGSAGSYGLLLETNIDAAISSRLATSGYTAPPTAAAVADAVWEEAIADHSGTTGSTAEQLAAAGAGGDPWATAVPGAYSAGQAGYILGNNLDVAVSSRLASGSYTEPDNSGIAAIQAVTDNLPDSGALTSIAQASSLSTTDGKIDAVKAKTDSLTFTKTGEIDANIKSVADTTVTGTGQDADPWGP